MAVEVSVTGVTELLGTTLELVVTMVTEPWLFVEVSMTGAVEVLEAMVELVVIVVAEP